MERINNYQLQMRHAQQLFLGYDQQAMLNKLKLQADEKYIYVKLLCKAYRLERATGSLERLEDTWVDANTHAEVMTLLDLICDSRPDRFLTRRWKSMAFFGKTVHQQLLEQRDKFAEAIEADMPGFLAACLSMGGRQVSSGDLACALELFEGLEIVVQFWAGDEEFPAQVRFLWDENALMYLKYETMYFAIGLLKQQVLDAMGKNPRHR